MTGTEREGVPSGSFELDPASLPLSPDDIWYPGNDKKKKKDFEDCYCLNVCGHVRYFMMGNEDKTVFCFCHWGRKNKVLPDGSISYVGGITRQVIAKTGIKYNDFVNAVFDRLCIDPSDKILHFTVKLDRSQLIQLSDQEDVNTLLQFNDDFAHVYASSLEKEPYSRLPSVGAKKIEPVVSDSEPDTNPVHNDENDLARPLKKAQSNESAGDSNPLKKAWAHQSAGDSIPQQKEAVGGDDQKHAGVTRSCSNSMEKLNRNGAGIPEGGVQNKNSKVGTANEKASRLPSGGAKKVELTVDSDSESDTVPDSNLLEVYDYPDPEFSAFYKLKAQNCFAIDQIWACYDTTDGMPRFYAHIRKVYNPEFKVMFSWLEAHPEDQWGRAWVKAELPVGCGKFRRGCTEFTSDRLTFSHQVQYEMGKRDDIWYPGKVMEDSRAANSEPVENGLPAVPLGTRDKSRKAMTSLKSEDRIHATDGESSRELKSRTKSFGLSNSFGSSKKTSSFSDDKGFEEIFCDFEMDRSMGKFMKSVLLGIMQGLKVLLVGCGPFKVQNENIKSMLLAHSPMWCKVSINRNRFEIYPREGDLGTMAKSLKKSGLDQDKFEYEIVEVIEYSSIDVSLAHIPAFQLTGEKGGVLRGCWELDPATVPCYL
ncbi:hypothetical protein HAX54_022596 [Datura stramonium]|uniref:DUF3444 domain-containing protein n=1 Tax=Datura stramonium TaxID=4076 RepID=A0ABS8S6Q7_DATST|nr:hypothetical protein [Datura stramonium]